MFYREAEENGLQEFIPLSLLAECLITKIKFCQDLQLMSAYTPV